MKPEFLPYSTQWISADDVREVVRVLRSDWITQGPDVEAFEREFARFTGARHAVAVNSGTAGLHAACFAAGLGPGDEAVVPPLTFVATANAVAYTGARPVFADVEPDTGTLDPDALADAVGPRTKAVLPVDFAGHPADMDKILRLARRKKLVVIQDAAHSLGAAVRRRPVGSLADLTVFSFHPVKHITTGEGGMVTTDDPRLAERLRLFRSHGITKNPDLLTRDEGPWYYEQHALGYNYRVTDFQCALGRSQLRKAPAFVRARRSLAAAYQRRLKAVDGLLLPPERPWAKHAWHLYPVRLARPRNRRRVFDGLRAAGLGVQVHYFPVHLQPYYQATYRTREGQFPQAEAYYAGEISLPLFPKMRPASVERVARTLERLRVAAP